MKRCFQGLTESFMYFVNVLSYSPPLVLFIYLQLQILSQILLLKSNKMSDFIVESFI